MNPVSVFQLLFYFLKCVKLFLMINLVDRLVQQHSICMYVYVCIYLGSISIKTITYLFILPSKDKIRMDFINLLLLNYTGILSRMEIVWNAVVYLLRK